jgi:hypothetical protein
LHRYSIASQPLAGVVLPPRKINILFGDDAEFRDLKAAIPEKRILYSVLSLKSLSGTLSQDNPSG